MINKKYSKYIMWAAIAVLYILCFMIVLRSGYAYDDMWTHVERGMALNEGNPYLYYYKASIHRWTFVVGRIMIFSYYCGMVVNYLPLAVYKLMIVTAIFLDALVLGKIIKELTGSEKLMYLCCTLFPAVVSLQTSYFSAMYGFHALVQFTMLFVLLGTYLYIKYRKTQKIRYQVLSCVCWFISLGMYEVSYVLCVCFIVALLSLDGWNYVRKHFWKSIKTGLPQILVMLAWLIVNLIVRHNASADYAGSSPNFDIVSIVRTFLMQCSATLGLGDAFSEFIQYNIWYWISFTKEYVGLLQILTYIAFFAAILFVLFKVKDIEHKKLTGILWFGIVLIVFPAMIIGVSSRYQEEIYWFQGYIPEYIQSWGLALIAAVIVMSIGEKLKNKRKLYIAFNLVAAMGFSMVFVFDNIVGASSVVDINSFYQNHYDTMQDSIDAGLLDDIGLDYVLDVEYAPYNFGAYNTGQAYATMMLKKCNVIGWDDLHTTDDDDNIIRNDMYDKLNGNVKIITHHSKTFAALAQCNGYEAKPITDVYEYKAYSSDMNIFIYRNVNKGFNYKDIDGNTKYFDLSDAKIVKESGKGIIYHINFDKDIDVNSISFEQKG